MGVAKSMATKILMTFLFLNLLFHSSIESYPDCYTEGGQYTGTSINKPEETLTDTAEDCQRLCQYYDSLDGPACVGFSWVDAQHSFEEIRNRCTAWSYIYGILVDYHYVSGPTYC